MKSVIIPNLRWYGNEPRTISFPERWDLEVLSPAGFPKKLLSEESIYKALEDPIGSPPLLDLARQAREVVIVFDDFTRPTPISQVLPPVLDILERGGVPKGNIRFIPALGTHGAMHNIHFRKKLGDKIVENYPIYNHNPYEHCDYVGTTRGGTPIYLNREFLSCDLKIGIGAITPHPLVGFGGGGKLILPGVSGVETIYTFHTSVPQRGPHTIGMGRFEGNVLYQEIQEAVKMSGLQMLLNGLINDRGEITDLFAGEPSVSHLAGVTAAVEHYAAPLRTKNDIVIANAYAKHNEMAIAAGVAVEAVNPEKGIIILVAEAPEGQVCHYFLRSFGKDYGGRLYRARGKKSPATAPDSVDLIVLTQYPDRTMCDLFASEEKVTVTKSWEETLGLLEKRYPGNAKVAVIPDGTMQYFRK